MSGKVEICGVNTARLKVLTQEEMDSLLRRSKAGDPGARERLIEGNLRLVLSVIQRFDKRGENPDDLFQVGCIGLMKAIANFDPDKNVRFSTYGVPTVCECRNSKQRSFYHDKKTSPAQCNPAFS
jgi:RNA polymerase sporulation-specific sigma factor